MSSGLKANCDSLAASICLNFPTLQNWAAEPSYLMGRICSHSEAVPGNDPGVLIGAGPVCGRDQSYY